MTENRQYDHEYKVQAMKLALKNRIILWVKKITIVTHAWVHLSFPKVLIFGRLP